MSRQNYRLLTICTAAAAALVTAGTAQAVDLRDWGRKLAVLDRFAVLASFNSEAVLDKETQLVWERTPATNTVTQPLAKSLCANTKTGGRRGWRLPSVHEMSSLADPSVPQGTLALPAGHPFVTVPQGVYWTATRLTSSPNTGYWVNFMDTGFTGTQIYSSNGYRWCVRGSGPISEY